MCGVVGFYFYCIKIYFNHSIHLDWENTHSNWSTSPSQQKEKIKVKRRSISRKLVDAYSGPALLQKLNVNKVTNPFKKLK